VPKLVVYDITQYSPVGLPAVLVLLAFRKEMTKTGAVLYTTGGLARALLEHEAVIPQFQDPFTTTLSPIMDMISWIFHLPIRHRKALLDATRIQAPIWLNVHLTAIFGGLPPVTIHSEQAGFPNITLHATDLASYFDRICYFPLLCSMLSYFESREHRTRIGVFGTKGPISRQRIVSCVVLRDQCSITRLHRPPRCYASAPSSTVTWDDQCAASTPF